MTKSDPVIRKASMDDARRFFDAPPKSSFRGYAIELDGDIVALFGVYYEGAHVVAFSDMKPALRRKKKAIVTAVRMLTELMDSMGVPVYAVPNEAEPTAPYLLARMGFTPTGRFGPSGEILVRG